MLDDIAFYAANAIAIAGWLSLIALPDLRLTTWLAQTRALSLLIVGVYLATFIASFVDGPSKGDFFSLDGVADLLSDRIVALVVWVHILAFDLFVGSHIFLDARRRGLSRFIVVPCLVATLLVGPLGLLAYRIAARARPATSVVR